MLVEEVVDPLGNERVSGGWLDFLSPSKDTPRAAELPAFDEKRSSEGQL